MSPADAVTVADVLTWLQQAAPLELAESWDNVGLILGDRQSVVRRVLTCLTLTPDVAAEAISEQVELVVTHHPLLFRPVQRITADGVEGRILLQLLRAGVAVYSPHTAYDSAPRGVNQQLADGLQLQDVQPLRPAPAPEEGPAPLAGGGRFGRLPQPETLREFLGRVRRLLRPSVLSYVGSPAAELQRVAVACGSAAEFLPDAARAGCQVLLTGEARFHACLEARSLGVALVLAGHYATERPAQEELARRLSAAFPSLQVRASRSEADPICASPHDE
jgi:dinuclear metal center YbgI/SA1388 family protein